VCPPEPALGAPSEGLRDRLRRLGAGGTRHSPAASVLKHRAGPSAEGVEVVRATFSLEHRHGRCVLGDALESLRGRDGVDLSDTLWLDTETTGLAGGTGTYAFLIGLAYLEGTSLVTEQLLLRRLSGETQLLAELAQRLSRARRLVTFNGQRFDWPILEARFVLARQRLGAFDAHTDLIHAARRLWHRVFGTHRLSVLEAEVLGAPRRGDVAGWEIPTIYVGYLRSTDRATLDPIVAHNRSDLLALVLLHGEVARVLRAPQAAGVPLDWEGIGVLLAREGARASSVDCFERAARTAGDPSERWRVLRRLARAYRAVGDPDAARARWETEAARWTRQDRLRAHLLEEVAKVRARRGDRTGAAEAAEEALSITSTLSGGGVTPSGVSRLAERLRWRLARLAERHR
jgi:uncharacterized protein YprB with RNaseH-like and TPR domain